MQRQNGFLLISFFIFCQFNSLGQIEFQFGNELPGMESTLVFTKRAYVKPSNTDNVFYCIVTKQKSNSNVEIYDECLRITLVAGDTLKNKHAESQEVILKIHSVERFKDGCYPDENADFKTAKCMSDENLNTDNWIYGLEEFQASARFSTSKRSSRFALAIDSVPGFAIRNMRSGLKSGGYINRHVEFDVGILTDEQIRVAAIEKMIYLYLTEEINYEYQRHSKNLDCMYDEVFLKSEVAKKKIHFVYNYSNNHIQNYLDIHKEKGMSYLDYNGFSIYNKSEFTLEDFRVLNVYKNKKCFLKFGATKKDKTDLANGLASHIGVAGLYGMFFTQLNERLSN